MVNSAISDTNFQAYIYISEWTSMNEGKRQKLKQQITFNEKEQELYIMRTSKTILSNLHRGFDGINRVVELWF